MNDKAWVDVISGLEEEDLSTPDTIDKLILEHRKAIKEHRAEIKRSQRSIDNLEYKKKKLKYGEDTVYYEVADQLHSKCTRIHDDKEISTWNASQYCDYDFYTWDNYPKTDVARMDYYNRAKRVVETARELNISIRKAMQIIDAI